LFERKKPSRLTHQSQGVANIRLVKLISALLLKPCKWSSTPDLSSSG
jgi:hypothetical protein